MRAGIRLSKNFGRFFILLLVLLLVTTFPKARAATVLGVVGDWGASSVSATNVANMVTNTDWGTDYIFTLGDNNYGQLALGHSDWESLVGARYGDFIQQRTGPSPNPYPNQTSATQRFFPSVGNHDVSLGSISGHLDYFDTDPDNPNGRLPDGVHDSTQSYYDVEVPIDGGSGSIHLFAMDSESFHSDTNSRIAQEAWLQQGLENSTATWNFVYLHRAPYSSSAIHGSHPLVQLPFQRWGAHAVLAGHDHLYERLRISDSTQNEMLYFVNGSGGRTAYPFGLPVVGSEVRYNQDNGAMRITVTDQTAKFEFLTLGDGSQGAQGGFVIDTFTLDQNTLPSAPNADFDDNGIVDGLDLAKWKLAYGTSDTGDANSDLDSDGSDFLLWQQQLGMELAAIAVTENVPEPSTALLLLVAMLTCHCRKLLT